MEQFTLRLIINMLLLSFAVSICLDYGEKGCILCDEDQRLAQGKCYDSVRRCIEYDQSQMCALCEGDIEPDARGQCPHQATSRILQSINLENNITLYTLAYGSSSQSSNTNYLDPLNCTKDPLFDRCDSFLRKGEYGHFISKTSIPWQSISF